MFGKYYHGTIFQPCEVEGLSVFEAQDRCEQAALDLGANKADGLDVLTNGGAFLRAYAKACLGDDEWASEFALVGSERINQLRDLLGKRCQNAKRCLMQQAIEEAKEAALLRAGITVEGASR